MEKRMDVTLNLNLIVLWVFELARIFDSALNIGADIEHFFNDGCQLFSNEKCSTNIGYDLVEIFFCVGQLEFLSLYG